MVMPHVIPVGPLPTAHPINGSRLAMRSEDELMPRRLQRSATRWLGVHLFYLIGFQNRVVVITRWAFNFLTHGRGARLIRTSPLRPRVTPQPRNRTTADRTLEAA